jgi:hypothetical protein
VAFADGMVWIDRQECGSSSGQSLKLWAGPVPERRGTGGFENYEKLLYHGQSALPTTARTTPETASLQTFTAPPVCTGFFTTTRKDSPCSL